jgi:hypothetical protein
MIYRARQKPVEILRIHDRYDPIVLVVEDNRRGKSADARLNCRGEKSKKIRQHLDCS